jgi:hypothetical protein
MRVLTSINDEGYVRALIKAVIIRNENVALESERDPEFKGGVEGGLRALEYEIHRLHDVMSS